MLSFDDYLGNIGDGLLPLVNAFNEKLARRDLLANVIFHFGGLFAPGHQFFIRVADAQVRNLLIVQQDRVAVLAGLDRHIGGDILLLLRAKHPAGLRFQRRNEIGNRLDLLHGQAQRPANLHIMFATEIVQVFTDNFGFNRSRLAKPVQLDQQTFPQIARADTDRMKRLHHIKRLL